MASRRWAGFSITIAMLFLGVNATQAAEPGRVSDLNGTLKAKGGYDEDWTELRSDLAIGAGDSLWLAEGLAELELPGGTRVRFAGESKLDLIETASDEAAEGAALAPVAGQFYVHTADYPGAAVAIALPAGSLALVRNTTARLEVRPDAVEIWITDGRADFTPNDGNQPVRLTPGESLRLAADGPFRIERARPVSGDRLERYQRERERQLAERAGDPPLDGYVVGQEALDSHGRWIWIGGVRHWRPYVSLDWRPYTLGHWVWYRPYGWTWVSSEPFGYAVFHYGRWRHDAFYGWVWLPGTVWAPAHVHWVAMGPYTAWAPLDPWGYPVTTGRVSISFSYGFGFDYTVWSYTPTTYFVVTRPPRAQPVVFKPIERRFVDEHPVRVLKPRELPAPPNAGNGRRFRADDAPPAPEQRADAPRARRTEPPASALTPQPDGRRFMPNAETPRAVRRPPPSPRSTERRVMPDTDAPKQRLERAAPRLERDRGFEPRAPERSEPPEQIAPPERATPNREQPAISDRGPQRSPSRGLERDADRGGRSFTR